MENLQDILNKVANSDLVKNEQLYNISKRRIVYVFKNKVLFETLVSIEELKKKYKGAELSLNQGYERNDGFYFSYENEYKPKRNVSRVASPIILVYYKNDFVGEFKNPMTIANSFNLNRRDIIACLTNRKGQKSTKGYTFEYKK
jgi:hypothetical protein